MTPGRKPKPTALKLIAGNPGKRPLNRDEPKPEPRVPACPEYLAGAARKEWDRITPLLAKIGVLAEIDMAALAAYCETYAQWVAAMEKVKTLGPVIRASAANPYPVISPYVAVANNALKHMRAFLAEFGMTPSSRSRIAAAKPDGSEDPDDAKFFG